MRQFLDLVRTSVIVASAAAMLTAPAHALLIEPSFDSTLTSQSDAAAVEAGIETAASTISNLYGNAGTVQILFEYNSQVGGAETDGGYSFVSYSQYTSQLGSLSTASPQNTVLATAVKYLGDDNTADYVLATTALLRVGQGYTGQGTTPCFNASGAYVSNCNAIYDAVITIGNASTTSPGPGQNSQVVSEMEHEIDEVLGGGGAGSTIGENLSGNLCPHSVTCSLTAIGPTDLYRFQSSGSNCSSVTSTPSYTTSTAAVACFSITAGQSVAGGQPYLVQMNQAGSGSDYGDFVTPAIGNPNIQDAYYNCCSSLYTSASPEFTMMESIGYDANLPEPSSLALITGAIGGLGWLRRRRVRPA